MRKLLLLTLVAGLGLSCNTEKDNRFLVASDQIGKLTRQSQVSELETIFGNDSIVKDTTTHTVGNGAGVIRIYEKGGAHLLTLTPSADSVQKIENVRIMDPRYKTEKGIGLQSSFNDIRQLHSIKNLVTSISNIVVFLEDSDIYFTISKDELPANLRYSSSAPIEEVQIPDGAKLKYFMIGWDQSQSPD